MTKVARILSESEYYANFAYHEVGCRSVLEALMCGCGVLWGLHPLGKELPVMCMAATAEEAVAALKDAKVDVDALRSFALANYSYAHVKKMLGKHLHAH